MAHTALRLFRGVSLYSLAIFAPRLARLFIIPLVVRAVSIEVYGLFIILSIVLPFALIGCDMGAGIAALRLAPEQSAEGRSALFASLLSSRLVLATLVTIGIVLGARPILEVLTGSEAARSSFLIVVANVFPLAVLGSLGDQLRSEERHATLATLTAGRALLESALTVVWVVVHAGGLRGLLLARLWADLLMLVPFLIACRTTLRARPSVARMVRLLQLGAPIGLLYLLTTLRELDRYLIKMVLGIADVARYDLALRIVGPVALANAALAMALEPHVYRTFEARGGRAMITLFFACYVCLFSTIAFGVSSFAPSIFPLLAPGSYVGAEIVAPCLIFAFVADGVLRIAGLGAELAMRTAMWALVSVTHVAVAFPLTWVLLPRMGILGAAVALLLASLTAATVCRVLTQRVFPLELPMGRALLVIVVGSVGATALVMTAHGGALSIVLRLLATAAFGVVVFRVLGLDLASLRAVAKGTTPPSAAALEGSV